MASSEVVKDRQPLKEKDIVCLGHLKRVFPLLERLHEVGCGRDKAGNRELFFDDYVKTNLVELPAELVALIYRYRYTIELFFRIFKQLLGLRHLLSQREEGIDIQVYCTVIVCLLIQLISGKKPNKAMRNMVGWYLIGLATEQDLLSFLNRPDNTGVKLRAKEELWKKLGY